jgi:prepilin-type N-terminal cleavage/methylation domain-containing protein
MLHLKDNYGYTIVEVLLVIFILSVGISGTLLLFVNTMLSSEYAWDVTLATTHAESVLEEMQSKDTLPEIVSVDWNQWVQKNSPNLLPEQILNVTYVNPDADPLEILVDVQWKKKNRLFNVDLAAKLTK